MGVTAAFSVVGALFLQAAPVMTEEAFRAAIASNAQYADAKFAETGLQPLEEAARQRRDIKRLLSLVWLPGRPPAMEVERHSNGSVTLALHWRDKPPQRYKIAPGIWQKLSALEGEVFARPTLDRSRFVKQTWASCHGDQAFFQSTSGRAMLRATANQCRNSIEEFNAAKREAVAIFVGAAIATRPECAPSIPPVADDLVKCFQN